VTITHPYHPLRGHRVTLVRIRHGVDPDLIVQRATVAVLNAIYEEEFRGFSYGFRPGRSPHDALDAVTVGIEKRNVNWVLDADIRGFFEPAS